MIIAGIVCVARRVHCRFLAISRSAACMDDSGCGR